MNTATRKRNDQMQRCTRVNNVYRNGAEYLDAVRRLDPFQLSLSCYFGHTSGIIVDA